MEHQPPQFVHALTVRLQTSMGSDADIVSAARVDEEIPESWQDEKDDDLLDLLMANRHGTPFEHAALRFFVHAPIFVAREHMRHRSHSYNEFSTRYKRLGSKANPVEFYIPPAEDFRTQVGTPGHYTFAPVDAATAWSGRCEMEMSVRDAYKAYTVLLDEGIAKEMARNVLPLSTMTRYVWTCNPRSLMHFLALRNEANALLEIRKLAIQAEAHFARLFPRTAAAFVKYGRTAP